MGGAVSLLHVWSSLGTRKWPVSWIKATCNLIRTASNRLMHELVNRVVGSRFLDSRRTIIRDSTILRATTMVSFGATTAVMSISGRALWIPGRRLGFRLSSQGQGLVIMSVLKGGLFSVEMLEYSLLHRRSTI